MVQIIPFVAFFLASVAIGDVVAQPIKGGTAMRMLHGGGTVQLRQEHAQQIND